MGGPGSGRKKGSKNKGIMPGILGGHSPNKMNSRVSAHVTGMTSLIKQGQKKRAKIVARKSISKQLRSKVGGMKGVLTAASRGVEAAKKAGTY